MKNLFIIGTPLQLINAIEAVKHFELENNILIIIHRSLDANRTQIEELKSLYNWDEVIEISYSRNSSILKYINLVKKLKKHIYKYIFISKLEVVPKIIIANVKKEKVFLLDDGCTTIWIYETDIKTNKLNKYNIKELRFLLFGLRIKIRDKINLFTYFDLKPVNGIKVVKNSLKSFKDENIYDNKKYDDVIFFLGQPISNLVNNTIYRNSLEKLIEKYNKKMIYIPHRGETQEKIEYLNELDNSLFTIQEIGMPVELYFLNNKIYPQHVISYYSAALATINLLYEDCMINYLKVPENSSNKAVFDKFLRNYYEVFDNDKILTLQDLG